MKILTTIPHYYNANNDKHGSGRKDPTPRIRALSSCLFNLHSLFGNLQCMINIKDKNIVSVNFNSKNELDIIICTANQKHILEHLNLPQNFYTQQNSKLENPKLLGFECQKILKEGMGDYDYYCFMEDDLIINDSQFFEKLNWFNKGTQSINLLQPNRYEASVNGKVLKSYIDGDINTKATAKYQNINEFSHLHSHFLGHKILFQRPFNPHSGCFFLTQEQMQYWVEQPHFLDEDVNFISPLESTATLGIMKTFRIYKPATQNANFLEIQHFGNSFISLIGNEVKIN